jgi:expansin (peptidoglycan-binding protein)
MKKYSLKYRKLLEPMVLLLSILNLLLYAEVDDGSVLHTGEATFYGEGGLGHCGFTDTQPQYHGAMNHMDYDSSAACGTWVHIFGPKGDVIAFIDDECPECLEGDIDLGPTTFDAVADRHLGRVPIKWRYIQSPVDGPVQYYWKEGASQHHLELQVRNHRYGITKLEIQTQTSEWVTADRFPYNFFKKYGGINREHGPYNIRITDIFGNQLTDRLIHIIPKGVIEGNINFPVMPNPGIKSKQSIPGKKVISQIHKIFIINRILNLQRISGHIDIYSLHGRKIGTAVTDHNGMAIIPDKIAINSIVIIK